MKITLQYFDSCPNWQLAESRLQQVLVEEGRGDVPVERQRVESPEEAKQFGFRGSPTILIDGTDPFAAEDDPVGVFSCRIYRDWHGEGAGESPTLEQLRAALTS